MESPGIGKDGRRAALLLLEEWVAGIPGLIVEDGHGVDWAELYPTAWASARPGTVPTTRNRSRSEAVPRGG
jgi:hypothetical protein